MTIGRGAAVQRPFLKNKVCALAATKNWKGVKLKMLKIGDCGILKLSFRPSILDNDDNQIKQHMLPNVLIPAYTYITCQEYHAEIKGHFKRRTLKHGRITRYSEYGRNLEKGGKSAYCVSWPGPLSSMRHQPDSRNSVSQFLDSLSRSSASNGSCETYQKGKIFTRTMSGDFQQYRSDN